MYKVTKKYARGSETPAGSYKTSAEAKKIIQEKLAQDESLRIKDAIYCLYEGFDLLETFDQSKLIPEVPTKEESNSASGMGTGQRFSPSPFNTAPQPKGAMPKNWVNNDDDNKKDK